MKNNQKTTICALATILAATTIGASGCAGGASYQKNGVKAYAYGHIDAPKWDPYKGRQKVIVQPRERPTSRFPEKKCVQYAASAAESRKKDGKRVTQCYYKWR